LAESGTKQEENKSLQQISIILYVYDFFYKQLRMVRSKVGYFLVKMYI